MVETGPYAYQVHSYKYDVSFHANDSSTISYKEYNILKPVTDPTVCQRMYYRMDKDQLIDGDPCENGECICQDPNNMVTILNPLYLKVTEEEGPNLMISQYAVEIFQTLKTILTVDFVEATKAHLVPYALEEIYVFRTIVQVHQMINTSFEYVRNISTDEQMAEDFLAPESAYTPLTYCGMDNYDATDCRWNAGEALRQIRSDIPASSIYFKNVTDDDIPYDTVPYLIDPSSNISFLNLDEGFPGWIAVSVYLGFTEFPFPESSAMVTDDELEDIYNQYLYTVASLSFPNPDNSKLFGAEMMLHVICYYLEVRWMQLYENQLISLVYDEWMYTSEPVMCSMLGVMCVWQWGAVSALSSYTMTDDLVFSLIDRGSKVNTNPNSLYYDGNAASIHNSYRYCKEIIIPGIEPTSCMDIDYAEEGATFTFPAGLASIADGIAQINASAVAANFAKKSQTEKNKFIYFGCNISYLAHEVYRESTAFHDEYVIRYLNKYKLDSFEHEFTIDNWEELGYAQWGGGYVTEALVGVYSTYNLYRDGMWYIGQFDYYRGLIEYYAWALRSGYPDARLSNVTEAKIVLDALTREDDVGVALREHIMYRATTLIGDGERYVNGVGDVGEVAYLAENNIADFSCEGEASEVCAILAHYVDSSAEQCQYIDTDVYDVCTTAIRKRNNWVTECSRFETSMTSPVEGIQCDLNFVVGKAHPYTKSRGIIVEKMMFSLVIEIVLKLGLWCPNYDNCEFERSGLFTTVQVKNLLFEGYADASVNKYLSVKHKADNISFECVENPYDECGIQNFHCNKAGIQLTLPNDTIILNYGGIPFEKFFVERFFIYQGRFIWPYDKNDTVASAGQEIVATHRDEVFTMINPYFTLYPAWDADDYEFTKFYQCQGRFLYGSPGFYPSCIDTVNSGKKDINEIMNLIEYRGNDTMYYFDTGMVVNGSTSMQLRPFLWDGFQDYPYSYRGTVEGPDFDTLTGAAIFNRVHSFRLILGQSLLEPWDRFQTITSPFRSAYEENATSPGVIIGRRYLEEPYSWNILGTLGTPKDSYGMPYEIPTGMASLARLAGFPVYIGTPHNYGNYDWGGFEYLHVTGLDITEQRAHRSFLDYDPITGKILRMAQRQMYNIRVERTSLHTILFSSQGRCISPTKTFTASTGYGCFGYIPLFWTEESRTMTDEEFRRLQTHFYSRPGRAYVISIVGIVFGSSFFIVGAVLYFIEHRKRKAFKSRIYID
eukprot:CAMPEP_0185037540 /NCGR_PEP_ID=MMETSP1103-20130426/32098_1 /TAXON_ID=36769 /ORGANISM="Paraphysomonas bandaiensis, Strain Caron Lab Isolate" /LENGTH=1227 /DNA_ID=CAMNT_0027575557 /DNA_START=401 /DNA_END=4084 /DNA_ORIENTATION=-